MRICISIGCERKTAKRTDTKGYRARCGSCIQYMARYNMTRPEVEEMIRAQNNECRIYEREVEEPSFTSWQSAAVDHCHETGEVRGILCNDCNTALGKFNDDTYRMERAISYLRGDLK